MSLSNDPEQRRGDALPCTLRRLTHGDIPAAREIYRHSFAVDDRFPFIRIAAGKDLVLRWSVR